MKRTVQRFDVLRVDRKQIRRTPEGYLDVDLTATRVGVFDYGDHKELRPEGEVFNQDSLASLSKLPVTNSHPFNLLDSTTAKAHTVGFQTKPAAKQDRMIATGIRVLDEDTVLDVEEGKVEISMGYQALLEFPQGGGDFEGEHFDAIQREIRYNHIAIVDRGRAGAGVRLKLDSDLNQVPQEDSMIKVTIDGKEIEVKDQATADQLTAAFDAQAKKVKEATDTAEKVGKDLEALKETKGDAAEALEAVNKATERSDKAEKAAETEKGRADAAEKELKTLKDPKRQDELIAARIELIDTAKAVGLSDEDLEGKSDRDVKIAVISKVDEDAKLDDDTKDEYLDGQMAFIAKGMTNRSDAAKKSGSAIMDALKNRSNKEDEGEKTDEAKKKFDEAQKARSSAPMGLSKQPAAAAKI